MMLTCDSGSLVDCYCENSFIKVPFEEIKRISKSIQKLIERDQLLICSFFANKSTDKSLQQTDTIRKGIETSKRKLTQLHEKISSEFEGLVQCFCNLQARIELIENAARGRISLEAWNELRILRLINDYLLRTGNMKTFECAVAMNEDLHRFSDYSLFFYDKFN